MTCPPGSFITTVGPLISATTKDIRNRFKIDEIFHPEIMFRYINPNVKNNDFWICMFDISKNVNTYDYTGWRKK